MSRNTGSWLLPFLCMAATGLGAQENTLLNRFFADPSPLSLALGGLGTTLIQRIDGIFTNPSLAASNRSATLQLNFFNDHFSAERSEQTDPETGKGSSSVLGGSIRGIRSIRAVFPWTWQNLTIALCGGWNRLYPYSFKGSGRENWTDENGDFLKTETVSYRGRGGLDTLWVGGALAYADEWGLGLSHSFWTGEGEWSKNFGSDTQDDSWSDTRLERIDGGFWTIGAYFRPLNLLMLSASLQTRTRGTLVYAVFDETSEDQEIDLVSRSRAKLRLPETLTFGLSLGPVHKTTFHAEFHTQFWSQSELSGHPLGAMFPSLEIGEQSQRNEVVFSLGFSHVLKVNGLGNVLLAAGLGWEQPIFFGSGDEPLMLHRYSMGAQIRIGKRLSVTAAFRYLSGDWKEAGRFESHLECPVSCSRSTVLLGVEVYPFKSLDE